MNTEAYRIRAEINRLKQRLLEIEGENIREEEHAQLCASNVCGQDEVINIIQKLCNERGTKNIAIMAAWEKGEEGESRWYSTTIGPQFLPKLLSSTEVIITYLKPLTNSDSLRILEYLMDKGGINIEELEKNLDITKENLQNCLNKLNDKGLIKEYSNQYLLTSKGWQSYIVLGHLAYNFELKLDVSKTIKIAECFKSLFDKEWGEYLGKDYGEVLDELRKHNWLEKLLEEGVTLEEIKQAVNMSNITV